MAGEKVSRRLTAVLHADVVGYSRLMQEDEQGTVAALTARRALFAARVSGRGGRIVNAPGDSVLAEFGSVTEAVESAVEIQEAVAKANSELPEGRQMKFRIGINLGDVLVDDAGIYGDGVNVAARLEALAPPGGVCVSRAVREQVRENAGLTFEDAGEHAVKNIVQPIHVYRLRWGEAAPSQAAALPATAGTRPMLSIVVLPFSNLSGDAEQEYLADGISDDLTTDLSRISGSFVIARNSAFTYKGKSVDVKQVGRELGVSYALEGSVRRAGDRVRVNAQLIDTHDGAHVWADRFDRDLGDMLALQDDITGNIARVLRYELIEAESRRSLRDRPSNPRAIDLALRAHAAVLKGALATRDNVRMARALYEEGLRLDPNLLVAIAGLASCWIWEATFNWTDDPEAALAKTEALIARGEAIAPNDTRILHTRGTYHVAMRQPERALPILQAAHARDPNSTQTLLNLGWCCVFLGRPEAAIAHVNRALRLDPRGYNRANMHGVLGSAHLYLGHYTDAIRYLRLTAEEIPQFPFPRFMLSAALALSGSLNDARAVLAEFRHLRPGVGIAQLRAEALSQNSEYLKLRERVYDGLKRAGLED